MTFILIVCLFRDFSGKLEAFSQLTGGTLMPISVSPAAVSFWNISVGLLGVIQDLTQFSMKVLGLPSVSPPFQDFCFSQFPIISAPFFPFQQEFHFLFELCALMCCRGSEVSSEKSLVKCSVLCSHICFPSSKDCVASNFLIP